MKVQTAIVNAKDLVGEIKDGTIVYFNGEPFEVVETHYHDELGDGVLIQSIYSDKVINFEFEKIKRKWEHS